MNSENNSPKKFRVDQHYLLCLILLYTKQIIWVQLVNFYDILILVRLFMVEICFLVIFDFSLQKNVGWVST